MLLEKLYIYIYIYTDLTPACTTPIKRTMANTKHLSSLVIFTILVVLQLHFFSSAQAAVKEGYWYYDSGLDVSDIDSSYFTRLFCAFANLDINAKKVTIPSSSAATFSTFTRTVQQKNPLVKTLLSIGGGGDSTLASNFSAMASPKQYP